jgi:hypothetical protein
MSFFFEGLHQLPEVEFKQKQPCNLQSFILTKAMKHTNVAKKCFRELLMNYL